jgi:hypothetical protein
VAVGPSHDAEREHGASEAKQRHNVRLSAQRRYVRVEYVASEHADRPRQHRRKACDVPPHFRPGVARDVIDSQADVHANERQDEDSTK